MTIRECLLLLPGHGLDDFPRTLPSDEADQLLSGWVALWHPQLIAATQTTPRWQSATYPPSELNGIMFVMPRSCDSIVPSGWLETADQGGAKVRPARAPWREFQSELLDAAELNQSTEMIEQLRDDFAALGYAFLQVQLMTRQLRYTSNLDELLFNEQVLQASRAAIENDRETAERMLQSCFDQLGQERDHYYSLEVSLIDITLLAPSTLGNNLAKQMDAPEKCTSIIASAGLLQTLDEKYPENFQRLREAMERREVALAGGLEQELPHPLMSQESIRRDLQRGRKAYAELGIAVPKVFTRFSFGMLPDLPLFLKRSGFNGALLVAWESGSYPQGTQAKISWEASDGTYLSTLAPPRMLDAADPACFLTFGWQAGEALDHEQAPAIVLAHWPARTCEFYHLLRRIARRTPALGKWVLVDDYFDNTDQPYHQDRLSPGQFRFDWLSDQPNSAAVRLEQMKAYQSLHARANSIQNLANLRYQLENFHNTPPVKPLAESEVQSTSYQSALASNWVPALEGIWDSIDMIWQKEDVPLAKLSCDQQLDALLGDELKRLAKNLAGKNAQPVAEDPQNHAANAQLVLNPYSCAMRFAVSSQTSQSLGDNAAWVHSTGVVDQKRLTMVDVPPFGFVLAEVKSQATTPIKGRQLPLAEADGLLRNEFLEAQIDTTRGHLRSIHIPGKRGNRLSFSIARRTKDGNTFKYSDMRANRTDLLVSTPILGKYRVQGRLEEQGQDLGNFELEFSVWRGSRILEVDLRLTDLKALEGSPWLNAYVLRFAWPTEAAIVRSFTTGMRESMSGGVVISPNIVEIDETDYKTHLLLGGLAFNRRVEHRFLETLVAVAGQRQATARFGVAVDLPYPEQTSSHFLDRLYVLPLNVDVAKQQSSWFFHIDAKNTRVDLECPLVDSEGRLMGQRLRLMETSGKIANSCIRCPREVMEAYRVDELGNRYGKLTVNNDGVVISLRSSERVLVDVLWKV
jgi:alpha-mannosidase